jgi:hypothetical protein
MVHPTPIDSAQGTPEASMDTLPRRSMRKRKAPAAPLESQPPLKKPINSDKSHKSCASSKKKAVPEAINLTDDSPKKNSKKKAKRDDAPTEEKRLRRFRSQPPGTYIAVKDRALTQRLTVLSRERHGSDEVPEEKVVIAGSTGNVYTVNIGLTPECDCPHAKKGNQCKHIVYVMIRILKAQERVAYQLALLGSELRDLFSNAPPAPSAKDESKESNEEHDGNRKPIEGECPICYDDLDPGKETIVYCKASCGNNVHQSCMKTWMSMATRGKATCPCCRATWAAEVGADVNLGDIDTKGLERNEDGYVNVAGQLGLSSERDYSSYHQFWVRRHLGRGRDWD